MNGPKSAISSYREHAVLTAPRLKLVQMVYDEAIVCLKRAMAQLDQGDTVAFRSSVLKTQSIVGELFAALNYEEGQEIAEGLGELYRFSMASLVDANVNLSRGSLEAVLRVLGTLEKGWDSISDKAPGT